MKTHLMMHYVLRLSAAFFALGISRVAADAADVETEPAKSGFRQVMEQDYLLGDWGGLRTDLSKHGIDFEFFYGGSVPDNLDGGVKRGAVYEGALLMMLDLDSQKLVGYEGGNFH